MNHKIRRQDNSFFEGRQLYKLQLQCKKMEVQHSYQNYQHLIRYLILNQNVFVITSFLSFIQPQQLRVIAELALDNKRTQKFYRIAVAKQFMNSYLNRVDRSIFFLFYQDPEFQYIQKNTINGLAYNNYAFLEQAYHSFKNIFLQLTSRTAFLQSTPQLQKTLENIFFEPDMPMPKMKRETIGIYCQTAFQQFLSLKRFQQNEMLGAQWLQQPLQQLRQKLEDQAAGGFVSNLPIVQNLMQIIRFQGWKVNTETWKTFLIEDFHTHNLLVILFALSSQLVETFNILLSNIQDPFMRFIEFNLRSAIYRNIILSIEDQLAFSIKAYDKIFEAKTHPPSNLPPFNFWRAAFSIWAQKMSCYHEQNKKIYDYIIAKLRENSLLGYLGSKTDKLPSVYSELREEAQLNGFSQVLKDQAYFENGGGLEIQAFFQNHQQLYEVLAKDYLEYTVDMSLNEISVHWCGHSEHTIKRSPIYKQIMSGFLDSSIRYFDYLRQMVASTIPSDLTILIFRQILKQDLKFVGEKLIKPCTLNDLLKVANKMILELIEKGQSIIFGEEAIAKNRIFIQFQEKDNLLVYFASKAEIPEECTPQMSFYFNLQLDPQVEIPKIQMEAESSQDDIQEVYESQNEDNL